MGEGHGLPEGRGGLEELLLLVLVLDEGDDNHVGLGEDGGQLGLGGHLLGGGADLEEPNHLLENASQSDGGAY